MPRPLKLAILASHPVHYQVHLFRALAQHPDLEVRVFFGSDFGLNEQIDPTFGEKVRWYDAAMLDGLPHKFLKNRAFTSTPGFWNPINPGIWRELRAQHFDAILLHGYSLATNYVAYAAAKLTGTPVLLRGETALKAEQSWWRQQIKNVFLRPFLKTVRTCLPIGSRSREFYRFYGVPDSRMQLTPYCVDNDSLHRQAQELSPRKDALKAELGLPQLPVILYFSKLVARKRPMDVLIAFESLSRQAALVFAGDGPLRTQLQERVSAATTPNVHFLGFKKPNEMAEIFSAADMFVLPSTFEPWGLVINEAMCFELPVITTDGVAAAADLIRNGDNGFVYRAGDVSALNGHLQFLLASEIRRKQMGRTSSEIIRQWNVDVCVQGLLRAMQ